MSEQPENFEEAYKSVVNECSTVRIRIDENWDMLRKYRDLFCNLYGLSKEQFMLLHRANYYGSFDGTEAGKPAQLMSLIQKFAETVKTLRAFDLTTDLDMWLEEYGIKVDCDPVSYDLVELNRPANIAKLARYLVVEPETITVDSETISKLILNKTRELQSSICADADFIKKDTAKEVKTEFQIEPPHFVNAVRIDANRRLAKQSQNRIDKMHLIADSANKSVVIFEEPAQNEETPQ